MNKEGICSRVFKACGSDGAEASSADLPLVKSLWLFTSGEIFAAASAASRATSLTYP